MSFIGDPEHSVFTCPLCRLAIGLFITGLALVTISMYIGEKRREQRREVQERSIAPYRR